LARALSGLDASPKHLKLQSPFGSGGLERIGFEPCGDEVSICNWLELLKRFKIIKIFKLINRIIVGNKNAAFL
jgi:hypothetical protein